MVNVAKMAKINLIFTISLQDSSYFKSPPHFDSALWGNQVKSAPLNLSQYWLLYMARVNCELDWLSNSVVWFASSLPVYKMAQIKPTSPHFAFLAGFHSRHLAELPIIQNPWGFIGAIIENVHHIDSIYFHINDFFKWSGFLKISQVNSWSIP